MKARQKNKFSNMLMSILSLGVVVTLVSVYLYQSFQIDLIMKDLHQMHQQKKQLMSETERLAAEVERLSNIDVISKIAREKFDLQFSRDQSLVVKIEDTDNLYAIKEQLAKDISHEQKINTAGIQ